MPTPTRLFVLDATAVSAPLFLRTADRSATGPACGAWGARFGSETYGVGRAAGESTANTLAGTVIDALPSWQTDAPGRTAPSTTAPYAWIAALCGIVTGATNRATGTARRASTAGATGFVPGTADTIAADLGIGITDGDTCAISAYLPRGATGCAAARRIWWATVPARTNRSGTRARTTFANLVFSTTHGAANTRRITRGRAAAETAIGEIPAVVRSAHKASSGAEGRIRGDRRAGAADQGRGGQAQQSQELTTRGTGSPLARKTVEADGVHG